MSRARILAPCLAVTALTIASAACSAPPRAEGAREGVNDALAAEVAFVEVPAEKVGAKNAARMFYSFRPADTDPVTKPLAVIFNGGPGFATTTGLLAVGTGPSTIDTRARPGTLPAPNPKSWTRFANLLYIDERGTGFSYELAGGDAGAADCASNDAHFADAADFVRVLLAFFDAHPALVRAPVVLVGESYGGTRAMAMLDLFLRYSTTGPRIADDLAPAIEAHYRSVFPDAKTPISEDLARRQFGRTVLIEPLVAGFEQLVLTDTMSRTDPDLARTLAIPDAMYDMLVPPDGAVAAVGLAALADPAGALALFGVDIGRTPALLPAARANAFRRPNADVESPFVDATNHALAARFGALGAGDDYYRSWIPDQLCLPPLLAQLPGTAAEFAKNLKTVRMFLTRASLDRQIWSPAIVKYMQDNLKDAAGAPVPVVVDERPRAGALRPGWIHAGDYPEIRYPLYEAGHEISKTKAAELADDVEAWLAETR